jgi:hypothetical protein
MFAICLTFVVSKIVLNSAPTLDLVLYSMTYLILGVYNEKKLRYQVHLKCSLGPQNSGEQWTHFLFHICCAKVHQHLDTTQETF